MDIKPLFTTHLAADLAAGPYPGQYFHPKGSEITIASMVESAKLGTCSFSAPDPVFFYLKIAEENLPVLTQKFSEVSSSRQSQLFKGKGIDKVIHSVDQDAVYAYFQATIQFTVMLYSSVEAFVNQHIPQESHYETRMPDGKVRKYKDRVDFERNASTKQKLIFLSETSGLGHPRSQSFWDDFLRLLDLRNELIHLKTKGESTFSCYQGIYANLFDGDFPAMFESVKSLLIFFDPKIFD